MSTQGAITNISFDRSVSLDLLNVVNLLNFREVFKISLIISIVYRHFVVCPHFDSIFRRQEFLCTVPCQLSLNSRWRREIKCKPYMVRFCMRYFKVPITRNLTRKRGCTLFVILRNNRSHLYRVVLCFRFTSPLSALLSSYSEVVSPICEEGDRG